MAQPEKRFKAGSCEAAVFENELTRDGQTVLVKKVAIQKRYKDITGWPSPHDDGPQRHELSECQKIIDEQARKILAQELNHNRIEITNTYIGR